MNATILIAAIIITLFVFYLVLKKPREPVDDRIEEALDSLHEQGNGEPLLRLIVDDVVKWRVPNGRECRSQDGNLVIEDDMYFYLYVNGYVSYNLTSQEMSEMLECAAVNRSKVSRAVDNYTEYLEKRNG